MQVTIDLTGSNFPRDDLDYLRDAQQAVQDLLLPDYEIDRAGRERLCVLLGILDALNQAVRQYDKPESLRGSALDPCP